MDKKDELDEKDEKGEANLTKIANLLNDMPVEKRKPFADLIKGYLNDEL